MRRVIGLSGYWVIGFSIVFLGGYAFAQGKPVELTTVIAKIPAARIIDWEGLPPTVDKGSGPQTGWQGQALHENDEVCCRPGQTVNDFVLVALNRSADNLVRLSTGTCLTIEEDAGSSVDEVSQDSGEALFDLESLEEGSSFTVETPTAIIGVSGTTFCVIVSPLSTKVEVVGLTGGDTLVVTEKEPITIEPLDLSLFDGPDLPYDVNAAAPGIEYLPLSANQELTINDDASNIGPEALPAGRSEYLCLLCQEMEQLSKEEREKLKEMGRGQGEEWKECLEELKECNEACRKVWANCKKGCPPGKGNMECRQWCLKDHKDCVENCRGDLQGRKED